VALLTSATHASSMQVTSASGVLSLSSGWTMSISSDQDVPGIRVDGRYSGIPVWASPRDGVGVAGSGEDGLFNAAISYLISAICS